jgi:hypothetical protein
VLSPAAVRSSWVREELNAALMRQVASAGTFLLPVLVEDCDVPPLLAHRRFADFRRDYDAGLAELLELFERDAQTPQRRAISSSIRGRTRRFPTKNLSTCTRPDSTNSSA